MFRQNAVTNNSSESLVREFWRLMATNDFQSVASVLAPEFVVEWPQSNELIRGAERYARLNSEYPASGRWQFELQRLVANDVQVVTEVRITDGVQTATAISFFTIQSEKITRLVEYWPEPYEPPTNRAHLVEPLR